MATAWVNPDNTDNNTGFMDLLNNAIKTGGEYLIADKTNTVPAGYSRVSNTGAVPAQVNPPATTAAPTLLGAKSVIGGIDMRYVAAGFGALLIIGLMLRK